MLRRLDPGVSSEPIVWFLRAEALFHPLGTELAGLHW
jgi:hypothetical protein